MGDTVTLLEHLTALHEVELRLNAERDRRYSEVKLAEEKALAIKSTSDDKALLLARDIQDLKDEKANNLRSQIDSERGVYATKDDLSNVVRELTTAIKPLSEYVAGQAGRAVGVADRRLSTATILQAVIVAVAVLTFIILYIAKK